MSDSTHDKLIKLDKALDAMLDSDAFREKATQSDFDVLQSAALLINAPHPQLSAEARQDIRQQVLDAAKHTLAETQEAPSTDKGALSSTAKSRIFGQVQAAQQQLQIDALITSDEALAIAAENPDPVIQAAVLLRSAPVPVLSAQSKAQIRERILPNTESTQKRILRPNFSGSLQRVAASIAILLFASLILIPSSSANSLPGDVLYPVKRGLETMTLQLAASDASRATIHLNHAEERIEELNALSTQGRYDSNLLDEAFNSLEMANDLASQSDTIVFQNDFASASSSLDLVVQAYIAHVDADTMQPFIARQAALSTVLILAPENNVTPEVTETGVTSEPSIENDAASVESDDLIATEETSLVTLYANASSTVRVRIAPNLNADIIAQIAHGDAVTQIGMSANAEWIHVRLEDGQAGWIAAFLLVDYPVDEQADSNLPEQASENNAASSNANHSNQSGNANGNANGNASGNSNGNRNDN